MITTQDVQFCSHGCGSYPGKSCKWAFSTLQDRVLRPQSQFFRSFPGLFFLNHRGIRSVAHRQKQFLLFHDSFKRSLVVARSTSRLRVVAEVAFGWIFISTLSRTFISIQSLLGLDREKPTGSSKPHLVRPLVLCLNQPGCPTASITESQIHFRGFRSHCSAWKFCLQILQASTNMSPS